MLPTFRIPYGRHDYVDLEYIFNTYEIPGRYRDWIRRKVLPEFGPAIKEFRKEGAHGNAKHYCIAEQNAILIINGLKKREEKVIELPCDMTYTRKHEILVPFHGVSFNKMYNIRPRRKANEPAWIKRQSYLDWLNRARPFVGKRPDWLTDIKFIQYEFGHSGRNDADNLVKGFQDLIFQHTWGGNDREAQNVFFHGKRMRRGFYCKATIYC